MSADGREWRIELSDDDVRRAWARASGLARSENGRIRPARAAANARRHRELGLDEPGSPALAHLVRRAALEGVVCCGPEAQGYERYVRLGDWLGDRGAVSVDGSGSPCVRLPPAFDTYLVGHKGRDLIVDDRFSRKVWPGGGWIHPTVVVDGRVVATWKVASGNPSPDVAVERFMDLDTAVVATLDAEVERLRAFLGAA